MIFGLNGLHMRAKNAIMPRFCMEFRPGSNGQGPGPQNLAKIDQRIKHFALNQVGIYLHAQHIVYNLTIRCNKEEQRRAQVRHNVAIADLLIS